MIRLVSLASLLGPAVLIPVLLSTRYYVQNATDALLLQTLVTMNTQCSYYKNYGGRDFQALFRSFSRVLVI